MNALTHVIVPVILRTRRSIQPATAAVLHASSGSTGDLESDKYNRGVRVRQYPLGALQQTLAGKPNRGQNFQMFDSRGRQVGVTAQSDEDGWYFINYKHTGKAAPYTVKWLQTGQTKTITLRANGTAEANFP